MTLRPPFRGRDYQETLSQIIHRDPLGPRRLRPCIPRDLETVILKCLRKEPAARYGTAEALSQDLERCARGDPVEARPQSLLEIAIRKIARRRTVLSIVALVVLCASLAGVLFTRHLHEQRRLEETAYVQGIHRAIAQLEFLPDRRTLGTNVVKAHEDEDLVVSDADGSVRQTIATLRDLERASPERPEAPYLEARALAAMWRDPQALEALDRALDADTSFAPARELRSVLESRLGQEPVRRGASTESEDTPAWVPTWRRAREAFRSERWQEAVSLHTNANGG